METLTYPISDLTHFSRVLVGVSGGADSLALLSLLVALRRQRKLSLKAVYVNHGLRPKAARREEAFLRKIGKLWNVPVTIVRCRVKKRPGQSPEEAAREARYRALIRAAYANRCQAIALGHTQDDQAETVLMWILRGTGTTGLAGIPPVREIRLPGEGKVWIVRPLLNVTRQQVQEYLKSHGIRFRTDRSNLSHRFLRNRIRRELIPYLEKEYSPVLRRHLAHLAEVIREDLTFIRGQAETAFRKTTRRNGDGIDFHRPKYRNLPLSVRRLLLRLAVEKLKWNTQGFTHAHWEAMDRSLMKAQGIDLPHRLRLTPAQAPWVTLSLGSGLNALGQA